MKKEYVYAGVGFVTGLLIAIAIISFAPESDSMESASMKQMEKSLEGKKDAEFDMAFIDAMIVHHEGAIEMAKMALESTSRPEMVKLANDIVMAQEGEIAMMKSWREEWFK